MMLHKTYGVWQVDRGCPASGGVGHFKEEV